GISHSISLRNERAPMLFNSLTYSYFLPVVAGLYYSVPGRLRLWLLLAASYAFYAAWNPIYLTLIVAMTLANYLLGISLARLNHRKKVQALLLFLAIAFNVGILGYYKYLAFLLYNLTRLLGLARIDVHFPSPSIILPLGISFFVFEFLHYLVDVAKGH